MGRPEGRPSLDGLCPGQDARNEPRTETNRRRSQEPSLFFEDSVGNSPHCHGHRRLDTLHRGRAIARPAKHLQTLHLIS